MAVSSALLSVVDFARLPEPTGGRRQELHRGEIFELAPVKRLHTRVQKRLVSLLEERKLTGEYGVDKEFPFRPRPEYEVWIADVAVFALAQWEQTADDDYFQGVPAVVIEVLSQSNTASEMLEREEMCVRNGGHEFWLVDPQRGNVKVVQAGGQSSVYRNEERIESGYVAGTISVGEIFGDGGGLRKTEAAGETGES